MAWHIAADHDRKYSVPAGLAAALLVVGLLLVGAGALLWSRHGAAVFVDNRVLAGFVWCF